MSGFDDGPVNRASQVVFQACEHEWKRIGGAVLDCNPPIEPWACGKCGEGAFCTRDELPASGPGPVYGSELSA